MKAWNVNFMAYRKVAAILSVIALVMSIAALSIRGLSFGLDFTGGALVEVEYAQPADLDATRQLLVAAGFEDPVVQNFGTDTDVLIRLQQDNSPTLGDDVVRALIDSGLDVELLRSEFVGAQVVMSCAIKGGSGCCWP